VPALGDREPASLDVGLFELGPGSSARCLRWDEYAFVGELLYAGGGRLTARIAVAGDGLELDYGFEGGTPDPRLDPPSDWRRLLPPVRFSPGYGSLERDT
jgi:hypothetical protein